MTAADSTSEEGALVGRAERGMEVPGMTRPDGPRLRTWPEIVAAGPETERVAEPITISLLDPAGCTALKVWPWMVSTPEDPASGFVAAAGRGDRLIVLLPITMPEGPRLTT